MKFVQWQTFKPLLSLKESIWKNNFDFCYQKSIFHSNQNQKFFFWPAKEVLPLKRRPDNLSTEDSKCGVNGSSTKEEEKHRQLRMFVKLWKKWRKLAFSSINQSVKSQKQCVHPRTLLLWQKVCVKRHQHQFTAVLNNWTFWRHHWDGFYIKPWYDAIQSSIGSRVEANWPSNAFSLR